MYERNVPKGTVRRRPEKEERKMHTRVLKSMVTHDYCGCRGTSGGRRGDSNTEYIVTFISRKRFRVYVMTLMPYNRVE